MKMAIFALFMSVICLTFWLWQTDNHVSSTAYYRLKSDLDIATHDAALQVNRSALDQGRIQFDDTNALNAFLKALRSNLKMDNNNFPIAPNLFRSTDQLQYKILSLNTGCPGKPAGFPCVFDSWLASDGYIDMIYGPSIVAIISMRHPRPFAISKDSTFTVGSSHEYKGY